MKKLAVCALTLVLACNVIPALSPLEEPTDMNIVVGGIADVRPYFGKLTRPITSQESGNFLLATCGCGEWRILLQNTDGTQHQFPIQFYTNGDYSPDGLVKIFGSEDDKEALGDIDQAAGDLSGSLDLGSLRYRFSAARGEGHDLEIQACVMCHVGDDPIWPRPPTHPVYVPGVTDCFNCHTVTIN